MLGILLAMTVIAVDLPLQCDTLAIDPNQQVVELGTVGFAPDATLEAFSAPTDPAPVPCGAPTLSDTALVVTNRTARTYGDVWYVANPETVITSPDGTINAGLAFKIDTTGTNAPLLFESHTLDGMLDPNEIWAFRVSGYVHALLTSDQLRSPNQVGVTSTGLVSSGSVIAIPIAFSDADMDGVADESDNCPTKSNPTQQAASQGTAEHPPGSVGCACLCGDVNGNCIVNTTDANEIQRSGVPLPPVTSFDPAFCDVNGNGICNTVDANEIQRFGVPLPPVTSFSLRACAQS